MPVLVGEADQNSSVCAPDTQDTTVAAGSGLMGPEDDETGEFNPATEKKKGEELALSTTSNKDEPQRQRKIQLSCLCHHARRKTVIIHCSLFSGMVHREI